MRITEDTIARVPAVREWLAEQEAEAEEARQAHRAELAARLDELAAREEEELPPLIEATDETRAEVEKRRAALQKAQQAHLEALTAERQIRGSIEAQRRTIESELRGSASPDIADFRKAMHTEHEALRFRWATGGTPEEREAVTARLEAIRDAIREADRLPWDPISGKALRARLQKIRDDLPPAPSR